MGTQAQTRLMRKLTNQVNQTACSHELGDFALTILSAMSALSPRATINGVIKLVHQETATSDLVDVAQTYTCIKQFHQKKGWIRPTGTMPSEEGGRPLTTYALTEKGRKIISQKEQHMQRLLHFVERTQALANVPARPARGR